MSRVGEPVVQLKDGPRVHRVVQGNILFARAADDYVEVHLADCRTILDRNGSYASGKGDG